MSLSTQTVVSDGNLEELNISFDYLDRSTINVFFEGVPTPMATGLWSWVGSTSKIIKFTPTVPAGVQVMLRRKTDISEPLNRFSEGAAFRADTLDENFVQILHAAQEFADIGALPSDDLPMPVGSVASPGTSNLYARADHVHVGGAGGGGTGGDGQDGYSTAIVYAYQRSLDAPTGTPGPITFNFSVAKIVAPASNSLENGWFKEVPPGDFPLWVTACTAAARGLQDAVAGSEWTTPAILSKNGLNGMTTVPVFAYARTPTNAAPALPSNSVNYQFATGATVGLNNGWTSTIPPSYGGKYLWVITATASAPSTSGSDTIFAEEWAQPQLLAQDGLDGLNGGANGMSNAVVFAYKRAAELPVDNPGPVVYHFTSASITTPSTDALANGWYKQPPPGTGPMYVCAASASNTENTDSIAANEWSAPALLGSAGIDGMSVATLYVYQRTTSNVAPAKPGATVVYNFSSRTISGLSNGWSAAIPTSGGTYLWVTTATAAGTNTDNIEQTEWAEPALMAKDGAAGTDGVNGTNGKRGTVQIVANGSSWSTATANNAISAAGYGTPINRDIVTITNGTSFSETRFYDNGSWVNLTAYIDGNMLVTGTLSASKISGGSLNGITMTLGTGRTPSGKSFELTSGGVLHVDNIYGGLGMYSNEARTGHALTGSTYVTNSVGVRGQVSGSAAAANTTSMHGLSGANIKTGTSGLIGCGNGFDFYADGNGTNYGPFTGAHDCLLPNGMQVEPGDIVVDKLCVAVGNISNTLYAVEPSTAPMQPAVVGVYVQTLGSLADSVPSAMRSDDLESDEPTKAWVDNRFKYQRASMNAVGEGMVNVCGRGGNLKAGDFICSSSMRGKGMRQPDDLLHSYTVAKVREAVTFSHPDEVKMVPCIYLCG